MVNKGSSSRPMRSPAHAPPEHTPAPDYSSKLDSVAMPAGSAGVRHDAGRDQPAPAPVTHADARASRAAAARLLIAVDATEQSRWALHYALAQHRERCIEVELLFVAEPVTRWEVLRFRTQREIAEFQAKMAHWLLEDAAEPLRGAGIPVRNHFREGSMSSQIVEAAEQLGCGQIVLASPPPRLLDPLGRALARSVQRRARAVPVITVNRNGFLVPWQ
jgi:hypothetical protein